MDIKVGYFTVEVFVDELFTINSPDNDHTYTYVYSSSGIQLGNRPWLQYGIRVKSKSNIVYSAIVVASGGATSPYNDSLLVDNENLVLVIGDCIFSLHIPDLTLNWQQRCKSAGTCFRLFKFAGGYLIHGEMTLLKVSYLGKIEWEFTGNDIFTTIDGMNCCQVYDSFIIAKDWGYKEYIIDKSGKELKA